MASTFAGQHSYNSFNVQSCTLNNFLKKKKQLDLSRRITAEKQLTVVHRQLSRYSTARGSSTGLSLTTFAKVEAHKSFLFSEKSRGVENKEQMYRQSPVKSPDILFLYSVISQVLSPLIHFNTRII